MYLQNKYTTYYFNIINKAQHRQLDSYSESHHIIPKSLGGSNTSENLVKLTPREHFICHLLLTKMVESTNKNKMIYALWMMNKGNSKQQRIKVTSKTYSMMKIEYANAVRESKLGKKLSEETKRKISNSLKGKPIPGYTGKSELWYKKHAETHKGKSNTERRRINTLS
jgi:hypothetical protein